MRKEVNVEEGLAIRKEEGPETASCVTPVTTKQEDCDMHRRFSVNEDGYITDFLNPANNCHFFEDDPKDEMSLREYVLGRRLIHLIDDLIINNNPMGTPPNDERYQPSLDEWHSLWSTIFKTVEASHLNTLPVALSIQHRFNGDLNRKIRGWQHSTSLSLFVDDVERLLRDLYGESDIGALDRVRDAVFVIVDEFTRYLRKDLWQEHLDAQDIDYVCGIGLPEGYGLSGHRNANCAARDLALRARAVRANPKAFSKYTVEFVNKSFSEPMEDAGLSEEVQHLEEVKPSEEVEPWKEPF
jgi:hypothetical protein